MKGNKINADDAEPLYRIISVMTGRSVRQIDFRDMDEVEGYFASAFFLAGVILGKWQWSDFEVIELSTGSKVDTPAFLRRACIEDKCGAKVNSFADAVLHKLQTGHSAPYIKYPVDVKKLEGTRNRP